MKTQHLMFVIAVAILTGVAFLPLDSSGTASTGLQQAHAQGAADAGVPPEIKLGVKLVMVGASNDEIYSNAAFPATVELIKGKWVKVSNQEIGKDTWWINFDQVRCYRVVK